MGLIAGAIAAAAPAIIKGVVGEVSGLAEKYINREISKEEFEAKKTVALAQAEAEIQVAWAESAAEVHGRFMDSVDQTPIVRWVWTAVSVSQLGVILWHQVGIPLYTHLSGVRYPSSGDTFEYAYLLLAACIGAGPFVMGKAGGSLKDLLGKALGK